ncbi:metal ABC transporter permease, partial [Citreimonas sp.]|uniref:metal ABC transporter permease n=1 Tax=Citreimonas sp. TaxID=3036715 RepID=UPI0035C7BC6B
TSFVGAYASYFLNGATGGIIVSLQTAIFLLAFVFAPKHGALATRAKARVALREGEAAAARHRAVPLSQEVRRT